MVRSLTFLHNPHLSSICPDLYLCTSLQKKKTSQTPPQNTYLAGTLTAQDRGSWQLSSYTCERVFYISATLKEAVLGEGWVGSFPETYNNPSWLSSSFCPYVSLFAMELTASKKITCK